MKRSAVERLQDARHFAGEAYRIALGMDADIFDYVEYYHYAIRYCLLAVGEALRHVPTEIQATEPDLPWQAVINMRHRLAHDYWLVNTRIVLEAAQRDMGSLIEILDRLIARLPGEE